VKAELAYDSYLSGGVYKSTMRLPRYMRVPLICNTRKTLPSGEVSKERPENEVSSSIAPVMN
jgi:hypothetical protein